jgi:acetyl esterase/lipase
MCGPAIAGPDVTVTKNFQYGLSTEEVADLYLLKKGSNPLIILIHGGGWMGGTKDVYGNLASQYNAAGFSVMAINYRLSYGTPDTEWNVQLQDAQEAVRWIRGSAMTDPSLHIDPNRIGAVGDSAGGHLALFLGSLPYTYVNMNPAAKDRSTQYQGISPKVQAVGDEFGPSDLTAPEMQNLILNQTTVFGKTTYAQNPELIKSASPLLFMDRHSAPTCVIHGTNDTLVPIGQSIAVINKLQSLGVAVKYFAYTGEHGFAGLSTSQTDKLQANMINCMAGILNPTKPAGIGGWLPWR